MIDHYRKSGSVLWFEYHCWESSESADAEIWYRSQQKVSVLRCVNDKEYGNLTFADRCECGHPLVYTCRFDDGLEWDVFEDELLDSKDEFQRPAPSSKLLITKNKK